MFKKYNLVIVLLLFNMAFITMPVSAAIPVNYESSIQVRNLTSTAGIISLNFYGLDGGLIAVVDDSIGPDETKSYYQSTMPIDAGFNGSVVIASSVPLAAESNLVGLDASNKPISYAAYSGFSSGANSAYLPRLFKNNWGYNTFYYVQNIGSAVTNVQIEYSDGTINSITGLQPNQSHIIRQSDEAHTPKVFSAILTSDASPIAVTVVEEGKTLASYNGVSSGSTNPVMPMVNQNNYGTFTGIQIQNVGDIDSIITVSYLPGPGWPGTPCHETRTIPAGGLSTFSQYVFYETKSEADDPNFDTDCIMGETFVGSGKVTINSTNTPLVAIVGQLMIAANKAGTYVGFDPANGQQRIIYPLIMDRNYGHFSSWSIMNVGSTAIPAGSLVCHVTGTSLDGNIDINISNVTDIPVDGTWTYNHLNVFGDRFVGGASCTGPEGAKLIGSWNELGIGSRWDGIDAMLVAEGYTVTVR